MVRLNYALYGALIAASACYGQVASPLSVLVQSTSADPSCVKLYEQPAFGTEFLAVCAPNDITTTTFVQFPNASGVQLAGTNINGQNFTGTNTFSAAVTFAASQLVSGTRNSGTAAAPWNDFIARNSYAQVFKIAAPGTTFGTAWSMQTGATSDVFDLVNPGTTHKITIDSRFGGFSLSSDYSNATLGTSADRWAQVFTAAVAANSTLGAFTSFDGSVFRVQINNGTAGSNAGSAFTVKDFSGTTVLDVRYDGTTATRNLTADTIESSSALSTITVNDGLTVGGIIVPTTDASFDLGRTSGGGFYWRSIYTKGTIFNSDGSFDRVAITNPGGGSDSGAGITQLNAAGGIVFKTFYNGNIQTAYTGGGLVVMCVNSGGVLTRGSSATSC